MYNYYVFSLAYAVWMLEKITSGQKTFVMYDIACNLFKHLRVGSILVECLTSAVFPVTWEERPP